MRQLWREDEEAWRSQTGRADLVIGMPSAAVVVPLGRTHQDGSPEDLGDPIPTVAQTTWRGAGVPGPNLVLVVESASLWETQCDVSVDRRTEVIVCELEPPAVSCGAATVALEFYDGCGGQESVDFDGEEPPCSRIEFEMEWSAGTDALVTTPLTEEDIACIGSDSAPDVRPPPAKPEIRYDELLTHEASRIEVTTFVGDVRNPEAEPR